MCTVVRSTAAGAHDGDETEKDAGMPGLERPRVLFPEKVSGAEPIPALDQLQMAAFQHQNDRLELIHCSRVNCPALVSTWRWGLARGADSADSV